MQQETMCIRHSYDDRFDKVTLGVNSYMSNGQISISLYTTEGFYYADLSIFIEPFEYQNYMAVDADNLPMAEDFIQKYNLGELVNYVESEFASYPVYAMNINELMKWDERGVKRLTRTDFKPNANNPTVWDNIQHL